MSGVMTPIRKAKARALRKQGMSGAKIAKRLRINEGTLYSFLNRDAAAAEMRKKSSPDKPGRVGPAKKIRPGPISAEEREKIIGLAHTGASEHEIAEATGRSRTGVQGVLRKAKKAGRLQPGTITGTDSWSTLNVNVNATDGDPDDLQVQVAVLKTELAHVRQLLQMALSRMEVLSV